MDNERTNVPTPHTNERAHHPASSLPPSLLPSFPSPSTPSTHDTRAVVCTRTPNPQPRTPNPGVRVQRSSSNAIARTRRKAGCSDAAVLWGDGCLYEDETQTRWSVRMRMRGTDNSSTVRGNAGTGWMGEVDGCVRETRQGEAEAEDEKGEGSGERERGARMKAKDERRRMATEHEHGQRQRHANTNTNPTMSTRKHGTRQEMGGYALHTPKRRTALAKTDHATRRTRGERNQPTNETTKQPKYE